MAMVLDYWRIAYDYQALLRLLRIDEAGAALSNVRYLKQLGLDVALRVGTLSDLHRYLAEGVPVIAFVNTGMLSYWDYETGHAVTLIGIDDTCVVVQDPHLDEPARSIPVIEFEAAWIELGEKYAVIRR